MADPTVSVIIPTYNVAASIERAIASALAQAGVVVEVIVIDDGSTDATWDIVSNLADPRLKCHRLPANGGPSIARNAGIELARGEWIAVLDGDDALLPGRLQRCVARAEAVGAAIVVDNLQVRREAESDAFPMFADFARRQHLTLADFIAGNARIAGGHSLGYLKPVFSRAFLDQHQLLYAPALRIGEDYLLLAEALASGALCAVEPVAGYAYTVRAGSISHRLGLADIERMLAADAGFLARHKLDAAAGRAQHRRTRNLYTMHAFTRLVAALKAQDLAAGLRIMLCHPRAALLLWRPVWVRMGRVLGLR